MNYQFTFLLLKIKIKIENKKLKLFLLLNFITNLSAIVKKIIRNKFTIKSKIKKKINHEKTKNVKQDNEIK